MGDVKKRSLKDRYAECAMPRPQPDDTVDEELLNTISRNYRTLPTFEKTLFDEIYIKYYSLVRNDFLNCRWKAFKNGISQRVKEPYWFPNNSDLHFYNHTIRFLPEKSIANWENYRKTMKPGPGVDQYGQQRSIPNESTYKRGFQKTERPPKLVIKRKPLLELKEKKGAKKNDVKKHDVKPED